MHLAYIANYVFDICTLLQQKVRWFYRGYHGFKYHHNFIVKVLMAKKKIVWCNYIQMTSLDTAISGWFWNIKW